MTLHVAVVHGVRRVHLVAAAPSRDALTAKLADYVREHVEVQLRPVRARRVRQLLADGKAGEAVDRYFASVGERWDEEWLVRRTVELDAECSGPVRARDGAVTIV